MSSEKTGLDAQPSNPPPPYPGAAGGFVHTEQPQSGRDNKKTDTLRSALILPNQRNAITVWFINYILSLISKILYDYSLFIHDTKQT